MDVGEKRRLRAELVKLRKGTGLTVPCLAERPTLMQHLGSESTSENFARLTSLARTIQNGKQREAVESALRIGACEEEDLGQRRKYLAGKWACSIGTVINRENEGLANLVDLILQASQHQARPAPEKGPGVDAVRGLKRTGLFVKECAYTFMSLSRAEGGASDDELQKYEDVIADARHKRKELRDQVG